MYVRFEANIPVWYPKIPDVWEGISNFSALSEAKKLAHGFYPVIYDQPALDPATQVRTGPVLTVDATSVTATWTNVDKGLPEVQAEQIATLREAAHVAILADVPEYQQRNAALGVLSAEETAEVVAAINAHRATCNDAEAAVHAATTVQEAIDAAHLAF